MHGTLWVGCYPGLTTEMLDWIVASFHAFCREGARA
jgi:hypothetical protein